MKVTREIADKVIRYQELQSKADELYQELNNYFKDELGCEGFYDPFITDEPQGEEQTGGEFCDQTTIGEGWYKGVYYYPIENSDSYVGCSYEIF